MVTMENIQQRLGVLACPICHKNEFSLRIKSENPDGENVYTAMCAGCRYTFPVSTEIMLYQLSNPDIVSWLKGFPCPKCGICEAEMDFRCTVTVRESRLFLRCKSCLFEFNEVMAAEAYE
ncbi:MAG: hypothetical protein HY203_05340 [Nitrospirae bacterium]|nr:hypothetical protein [Nitrospirota bacterium]